MRSARRSSLLAAWAAVFLLVAFARASAEAPPMPRRDYEWFDIPPSPVQYEREIRSAPRAGARPAPGGRRGERPSRLLTPREWERRGQAGRG